MKTVILFFTVFLMVTQIEGGNTKVDFVLRTSNLDFLMTDIPREKLYENRPDFWVNISYRPSIDSPFTFAGMSERVKSFEPKWIQIFQVIVHDPWELGQQELEMTVWTQYNNKSFPIGRTKTGCGWSDMVDIKWNRIDLEYIPPGLPTVLIVNLRVNDTNRFIDSRLFDPYPVIPIRLNLN